MKRPTSDELAVAVCLALVVLVMVVTLIQSYRRLADG